MCIVDIKDVVFTNPSYQLDTDLHTEALCLLSESQTLWLLRKYDRNFKHLNMVLSSGKQEVDWQWIQKCQHDTLLCTLAL